MWTFPNFWICRMGKIGNQKRVVGLLLGSWSSKGILDIANSFAIPFDEDDKDRDVWFLDHEYLETMYSMFRFGHFSLQCWINITTFISGR